MAGILDLQVRPDVRRRGLARFLFTQMLRYLQEQYFRLIEIQVPDTNQAALDLIRGLGFTQVDVGRTFRRPANPQPPAELTNQPSPAVE